MKIALDAMGGDFAPATNIEGAIDALKEDNNISIILVGDESAIRLSDNGQTCLAGS